MKLVDVLSAVVVGVMLVVVVVQPGICASIRHQHSHRHYRGYRQQDAGSSLSNVPRVDGNEAATVSWPANCSHCSARQAKRDYRLASIKNEILRKLHLSSPPNITRRQLPDIPPLRDLIGDDMVSDSPTSNDAYSGDDYHSTTMKKFVFPTEGTTDLSRLVSHCKQPRFGTCLQFYHIRSVKIFEGCSAWLSEGFRQNFGWDF